MIYSELNSASGVISNPKDLGGLQLWYDCSDRNTIFDATTGGSIPAGGSGVKRLEDKSGNNNHATEGTNPPTRQTNIQNGRDVIRFNGSTQFLALTTGLVGTGPWTIFAVQSRSSSANRMISLGSLSNLLPMAPFQYNDGKVYMANTTRFTSATDGSTGWQLFTGSTPSGGGSLSIWRGGVPLVDSESATAVAAPFNRVGIRGSDMAFGDLGEVLFFNRTLTDGERKMIELYLGVKWAIGATSYI